MPVSVHFNGSLQTTNPLTIHLAGLERTFRSLQALTQIIAALLVSSSFSVFLGLDQVHTLASLSQLGAQLGLTRRFIRAFRFLDSFDRAYSLVGSSHNGLTAAAGLDVLSNTFNGLYLLGETVTILDALKIDGLAPWGADLGTFLRIESQRCWFIALLCGALSGGLHIISIRKDIAALQTSDNGAEKDDKKAEEEKRERQLKEVALNWAVRSYLRKVVISLVDLILPGSIVGWIDARPLTVGVAMLTTSVLSGMDVWNQFGQP